MENSRIRSVVGLLVLAAAIAGFAPWTASAQPNAVRFLDRVPGDLPGSGSSVAATRRSPARINAQALGAERIELTLLDGIRVTAQRTGRSFPRMGSTVWHGTVLPPYRGEVTIALTGAAAAATVMVDGRSFEIGWAGNGLHEIREINPAMYPGEDLPLEPWDLASGPAGATSSAIPSVSGDSTGRIDVMVVWTPAARVAAGGTAAAMQSVIDLSVANANASYVRSLVPASLRLVYSAEVSYTENTSSISTDLSRLTSVSDGHLDQVHALRTQFGADIVTLLGSGYTKGGTCGIGYLMSNVSPSFASYAFNVVDQTCAAGNLTYAHEVGHNQGLHHDPPNAGSTPSHPFAYGYQDPAGAFRTVMSYGSAPRIQHLSSPAVMYNGKPTGTASQNNAEALRRNVATVAGFRATVVGTCSYAVTPASLAVPNTGGSATVTVTTTAGCAWTAVSSAGWIAVASGASGSGSGTVAITVGLHTGTTGRTETLTVAGQTVTVTQAPAVAPTAPRNVRVVQGGGG